MRGTSLAMLAGSLAASIAGAGRLDAQTGGVRERDDRVLTFECRASGAALAAGRQDPGFERALRYIARCDETAPAALAGVWRRPPRDSLALRWLVDASRRVRDQRILDAALTVLRDDRRPAPTRLAAMRVLATYANTAAFVPAGRLEPGWRDSAAPVLLLRGDAPAIDGQRPLAPDTRERVVDALESVAVRASPEPVRYAARVLHTALTTTAHR
jgi:hypothetical protein